MTPEQPTDRDAPPAPTAEPSVGVLAALPRTRPQRTSARREAARAKAQSETAATPPARGESEPKANTKAKPKSRPKTTSRAKPKAKPEAGQAKPDAKRAQPETASKPKTTVAKKSAKRPAPKLGAKQEERAPKQGYEPEEEVELGATVHPPSGGELIESIADIFGELAGVGTNAGGRLLKDALSIFRRP